ncbi:MAG TPA: GNAT family N-acetyltransferase [Acetobacteraceae bacterium]|nr:GNAT family N-acetyltransferase [Acetobacteraceae bacterium]
MDGISARTPADVTVRFHVQTALAPEDLGLLWRDLEARADITFFLSWDWMGTWVAELDTPPLVLVGEAGGALVLLGLLVPRLRREAGGAIRVRGLHLHATGRAEIDVIAHEYNGFLVDRAWAGRAEAEAVAWLLGRRIGAHRCDELHIKDIVAERGAALVPPDALVRALSRKPSWRVDLDAVRASGKPYLDALSANTRQQIRRAMRLYEERGPLSATPAPDAETALAWLDVLAELHQRQWQARGEPGGFAFPFFTRFQRRLVVDCLPRGTVEVVRVSAGEQVIGYVYNLMLRGHVLAFVTGFQAEENARLKPGLVSHALCIQRHADAGARLYDFMAGDYRYKANLGQPGPEMTYLLLQHPTPMTRAERAARSVWERVRRLRGAG